MMAARVAKVHFATADGKAHCGMHARLLTTTEDMQQVTCYACEQMLVAAEKEEYEAQQKILADEQASRLVQATEEKAAMVNRVIHYVKAHGKEIVSLCGSMGEADIITHYVMQVNCGVCKGIQANRNLTSTEETVPANDNETVKDTDMKKAPKTPAVKTPEVISIIRDKAPVVSTADVITLDVPLRSAEISAKVSYLLALTAQGPVAIAEALNYHIVEVGAVLPPRRAQICEPGAGAFMPVEPEIVEPGLLDIWGDMLGTDTPVQAPIVPDAWGDMLGEIAPAAPAVRRSTLQVFSASGKMAKDKAPKAPESKAPARFTPGAFQIDAATGKAMLARYEEGETMSALVIAYRIPGDKKNAAKKIWNAINKARKAQA
jgi:hypothetical protein